MLGLPATKGFEVGSGFAGTHLMGSEHNDLYESRDGKVRTSSNRSGGVQGGISNGEELYFRTAFKLKCGTKIQFLTIANSTLDSPRSIRGCTNLTIT